MMIDIEKWSRGYIKAVKNCFSERIRFIGLQGSYGRGEASEGSDIDMVLILDSVDGRDIETYGKVLDTLPCREKICGFLSGETELENWEKADLFQLCYDTEPLYGSLARYKELISKDDIRRAVKTGACNIYHMCMHNLLYDKNPEILRGAFKIMFFTLSAKVFLETGCYEKRKNALKDLLLPLDMELYSVAKEAKVTDLWDDTAVSLSNALLFWTSEVIKTI